MTITQRFTPDKENGNAAAPPLQVVSDDGAITIANGVVVITKATAATITIADPPVSMDGAVLDIVANTAAAHTVSNADGSGFNAGGASSDVGTFGGAIGDSFRLIAYGGAWHAVNLTNVTLG